MSKWTKESGASSYVPTIALYLHERTRNWYVRLARASAGDPLEAKVYAVLAHANANNASHSGIGNVQVTDRRLKIILAAGPQAPSLAGAQLVLDIPQSVGTLDDAIGTAIWKCDLGKKIRRAQLWVMRALSKISTANGYFTDFAVLERGARIWEDAKTHGMFPYLGVVSMRMNSTDWTIGGAQAGTLKTDIEMRMICYESVPVASDGASDPNADYMLHDIRRALWNEWYNGGAFNGLVDDGMPVMSYVFTLGEPDLGMNWARDKGEFEFVVLLTVEEPGQTEVGTT